MSDDSSISSHDHEIEKWKIKNMIDSLKNAKGSETSMLSFIISPKDQISRIVKLLADELSNAALIKSRVNRRSVLSMIESIQKNLKLYPRVPPNGLVIYCGNVLNDSGKERKMNIIFEPFKPIQTSLYQCDKKFHTEALDTLLAHSAKYGFIIMDGKGLVLFGTLEGNTREVLVKITVDLPKKPSRGSQSAIRFARLRIEKRHNYIRKISETCNVVFMTDNKINVEGIVLGSVADCKKELSQSDFLDSRIQAKVIKIVDITNGGEHGFSQAIDLAADCLQNIQYLQEKKIISKFFKEIAKHNGKYCFGVVDTIQALELGGVETIICWDDLKIQRYVLKSLENDQKIIRHLTPDQEKDNFGVTDKETGVELALVEKQTLVSWLADNYKSFGAKLVIITDKTPEGIQFVHGFRGIGAILHYSIDLQSLQLNDKEVKNLVEIEELN